MNSRNKLVLLCFRFPYLEIYFKMESFYLTMSLLLGSIIDFREPLK